MSTYKIPADRPIVEPDSPLRRRTIEGADVPAPDGVQITQRTTQEQYNVDLSRRCAPLSGADGNPAGPPLAAGSTAGRAARSSRRSGAVSRVARVGARRL